MSKFRQGLVDRMINIYGFESAQVIKFCKFCEPATGKFSDEVLELMVELHEKNPVY